MEWKYHHKNKYFSLFHHPLPFSSYIPILTYMRAFSTFEKQINIILFILMKVTNTEKKKSEKE